MDDPEELARRFIVGYAYLLRFRTRSPLPGATGVPPAQAARLQGAVETLRLSGLIPAAECVTVEAIAESLDDQPPDIQAVLWRLVGECERLAATPERMSEVVELRRRHYPGVLESEHSGAGS